jgi:hypothetical protein
LCASPYVLSLNLDLGLFFRISLYAMRFKS